MVVVLCLAGCSGGGVTRGDAGIGSDADAISDDAPPGVARIRVHDESGIPMASTVVVTHTSSGEVIGEHLTGVDGTVTFDDPPAGMMATVLVMGPPGPTHQLFTVTGIEAGDDILVGAPTPLAPADVQVRVLYPGAYSGATIYLSDLGCVAEFGVVNPGSVVTTTIPVTCLAPDNDFDALAVARMGTTHLAFATLRDAPPATSGPTDLTLPAWVAATTRDFPFANLPAEITDTSVDVRPVVAGVPRQRALRTGDTFTVPPTALVDGWYVRSQVGAIAGADARIWNNREILDRDAVDPHVLDFATLGPRFETLDVDSTVVARPIATWSSSSPTSEFDATMLVLRWNAPLNHAWTIVMPAGATTVTMPALPESAINFRPATATYSSATVSSVWFETNRGYRGFRNNGPFATGDRFVSKEPVAARWMMFQSDLVP